MVRTRSRWRRPRISIWSRHSLRTVPTHRSATAFAFGAWTGVFTTATPSVRNTSSKGPENLVSRSRIRKRLAVQSPNHREVAGLLRDPDPVRASGHSSDVHPSRGELDEEQEVHRLQERGLHGEKVAGEHSLRLLAEEFAPPRAGPTGRRSQAAAAKDPPDGARPHTDTELAELALDPDAPPSGVLPAQAGNELATSGSRAGLPGPR